MNFHYTIYNLATDVQKKIHGGTVHDLKTSFDEARRNMLKNIEPPEMIRSSYFEQAIFDKIERYAVADDMKYDNVLDIKVLDSYRNVDSMEKPLEFLFRRQWDQKRRGAKNVFTIAYENGIKYAMFNHLRGEREHQHLLLNATDSLTQNGTWNVGGNVVNLHLDELNHISKKASLGFDINNSQNIGFINCINMRASDISTFFGKGAEFNWLNIPIPLNMMSVQLLMGSNSLDLTTDFYSATVNQPHDNNAFLTGWNLLKYMLQGLNSTGNPNPKAITWIQLNFTTNGQAILGCNIDSFVIRKGKVFEYLYNSQYCLIDSVTGAWKQWATNTSDILTAEEDTYQILMLETALIEQKYLYANNFGAQTDITGIEAELNFCYEKFNLNHTNEMLMPAEFSYVGGNMYDGYESDSLDDFRYGDGDNCGDVSDNVGQNNQQW